jgi:purine-binding chemotaxis protein CheW
MAEMEKPDQEQEALLHFVFLDGKMAYAVPPTAVVEVTGWSKPAPVPFTPDWIEGVLSVRGQIVPVLNLGRFFGLSAGGRSENKRVLVIEVGEHVFAVWSDQIIGLEAVSSSEMEEPLGSIPDTLLACCSEQFRLNDQLVVSLDLEKLLLRTREQVKRS